MLNLHCEQEDRNIKRQRCKRETPEREEDKPTDLQRLPREGNPFKKGDYFTAF